jgi:ABC-type transporter Mla subunit MlaD
MGPLDLLTAPLRSLLGTTEDMERDAHTLLSDSGELERQLEEAVASIHRASESMEHHVAVVETLAATVPKLAASVDALVEEMHALNATLKPVASTERDLSRLGHLFGRRHPDDATSTAEAHVVQEPPAEPSSTPGKPA